MQLLRGQNLLVQLVEAARLLHVRYVAGEELCPAATCKKQEDKSELRVGAANNGCQTRLH